MAKKSRYQLHTTWHMYANRLIMHNNLFIKNEMEEGGGGQERNFRDPIQLFVASTYKVVYQIRGYHNRG